MTPHRARRLETQFGFPVKNSLLAIELVLNESGLSKSTIYRDVKAGNFPAPVKLSARRVAWKSEDVQAWIDSRPPVSTDGEVSHG
jgi:prophage regulatory protein